MSVINRSRIRQLLSRSLCAIGVSLGFISSPVTLAADPIEHDMIGIVIKLRIGDADKDWQEWNVNPGVPFTIENGDEGGRWTIDAMAREREDGSFTLDATVRCDARLARHEHLRTAGKENLAMLAAQSLSCPASRNTLAAEFRLRNIRGAEAGQNIAPSWEVRFKICWDREGKPTTVNFLSADPPEFAATAAQIEQSVRTWTFHNEHGPQGPGCDIVPVIVN